MEKKSTSVKEIVEAIEEYFKPENLQQDANLISVLLKQQFLTIEHIKKLPFIRRKNVTDEIVLEALRNTKCLKLDESERFVIPQMKLTTRTTLILRDLPEDVTIDDVKKLLTNKFCGKMKEIHPDVNKTWFVTFANEEACMKTAMWIQTKCKFRGEKVNCRVKSDHNTAIFGDTQSSRTMTPKVGPPMGFGNPRNPFFAGPRGSPMGNPYQQGPPMDMHLNYNYGDYRGPQGPYTGPPSQTRSPRRNQSKGKPPKEDKSKKPTKHDAAVDYKGIFKLINKSTFEMVLQKYISNNPEGPEKPMNYDGKGICREECLKKFAIPQDQ